MRLLYLDCFSGLSGDMLLGALLALGLSFDNLVEGLVGLHLPGCSLKKEEVVAGGISAVRVKVKISTPQPSRNPRELEELLAASGLPRQAGETARLVLKRLAEAEARVHGLTLQEVHLHELGAADTLMDIAGVVLGLYLLGVDELHCSPLPLARGWIDSAHGPLPLPAPATLELLKGLPVYGEESGGELVTPTGAALVATLASSFGSPPAMQLEGVGYGAGSRSLQKPNLLRALLGSFQGNDPSEGPGLEKDEILVLEASIDNLNPEFYPHLLSTLLAAGALDAYLNPVQMKKGRPGTVVTALCPPQLLGEMSRVFFRESSTLGLRYHPVKRLKLPRFLESVETPWGPVRIKRNCFQDPASGELVRRAFPELEDCQRLALASGRPLQEIYAAALQAAQESG